MRATVMAGIAHKRPTGSFATLAGITSGTSGATLAMAVARRLAASTSGVASTAAAMTTGAAAATGFDALGNPVGAILTAPDLTGAVSIPVGTTDINAFIQARPTGTKYSLVAGATYNITTSIIPKTGITITGQLDGSGNPSRINGGGTVDRAVRGNTGAGAGTGWTIRNVVFDNFTCSTLGAVSMNTSVLIEYCEIRNTTGASGIGLWLGGTGARYCWFHDNEQYGVAGAGANFTYLKNCDVSYNNSAHVHDGTWDAGGTKWSSGAHDMVVQYNYVYNNGGGGLWWDADAYNITCDSNTVLNNDFVGIDYEISFGPCTITNNWVEGNALYYLDPAHGQITSTGAIYYGSDISINTSAGAVGAEIEIANNTVITGSGGSIYGNGIGWITQSRGASSRAGNPHNGQTYTLTHVYAHDNNITLQGGGDTAAGMVGSVTAAYSDTTNRFTTNTYHTPNLTSSWWQWNGAKTKSQWQAIPQDAAGTFLTP